MERIIFGDNQFFGIQHASDEKARALNIRFAGDDAIIRVLEKSVDNGIHTFMCTTHERMKGINALIRRNDLLSEKLVVYPCLPYAHKYANAVTESGISGALKSFFPEQLFTGILKSGKALLQRNYISMMQMLIDAEMAPFKEMRTPVIFLQNVITDLLLGLGMDQILLAFHNYVKEKYHAEAGYITMNFPKLLETLEKLGIEQPIICTSINKAGYRMAGGKTTYENILAQNRARVIAMQVLAAGALHPTEALEYICSLDGIESILFGSSDEKHIQQTVQTIQKFDQNKAIEITA